MTAKKRRATQTQSDNRKEEVTRKEDKNVRPKNDS